MGMAKTMKLTTEDTSRRWWLDSHYGPKGSPWLQSTLSELGSKTKAMLKLIEEEADSFAKRAEMYYKKRPELINMVKDFYKAHRLLAERYDQARSDHKTTTSLKSDSCSDSCESEVENPDQEKEKHEVLKLKEEIERLREENRVQKQELKQKDEEKIDVIRQLSVAVEVIKSENLELKKRVTVLAEDRCKIKDWKTKYIHSHVCFPGSLKQD